MPVEARDSEHLARLAFQVREKRTQFSTNRFLEKAYRRISSATQVDQTAHPEISGGAWFRGGHGAIILDSKVWPGGSGLRVRRPLWEMIVDFAGDYPGIRPRSTISSPARLPARSRFPGGCSWRSVSRLVASLPVSSWRFPRREVGLPMADVDRPVALATNRVVPSGWAQFRGSDPPGIRVAS
jgi:hypothetical protein